MVHALNAVSQHFTGPGIVSQADRYSAWTGSTEQAGDFDIGPQQTRRSPVRSMGLTRLANSISSRQVPSRTRLLHTSLISFAFTVNGRRRLSGNRIQQLPPDVALGRNLQILDGTCFQHNVPTVCHRCRVPLAGSCIGCAHRSSIKKQPGRLAGRNLGPGQPAGAQCGRLVSRW